MQNAILLDAIDTLPPRYVPEVLDFIGYLKTKAKSSFIRPQAQARLVKSPLEKLQEAMEGEAERVGWTSPDDVVAYIKQMRREENS
jgi:hypothetical protein